MNIKVEKKYAYMQTFIFLMRRVILAASIVFGGEVPMVQIQINIVLSILILLYIIHIKPFLSTSSIYFEFYNELTILFFSYLEIFLTDIIQDSRLKYNIGWAMVILTMSNLTVNIGSLLDSVIRFFVVKIKQCKAKNKAQTYNCESVDISKLTITSPNKNTTVIVEEAVSSFLEVDWNGMKQKINKPKQITISESKTVPKKNKHRKRAG